jgi:phage gpG-like protein
MLLTIKTERLKRLRDRLQGISDRAQDLRGVWPEISTDFQSVMSQSFAEQGWKPINPEYAAWKAEHGFSSLILEKTGRLKRSLTGAGPEFLFRASDDQLSVGTTVPYAGAVRKTRDFLSVKDEARRRWVEMIQDYVLRG